VKREAKRLQMSALLDEMERKNQGVMGTHAASASHEKTLSVTVT
jgi:hypothetical protein